MFVTGTIAVPSTEAAANSNNRNIYNSNNFSKTSGCLWQYCRDKSIWDNTVAIADFLDDNNSDNKQCFFKI